MNWRKRKSDKTLVFVFVPMEREGNDFQERVRDCFAAFNETHAETPEVQRVSETEKGKTPFWTWFLPNPLPEPKNEKL